MKPFKQALPAMVVASLVTGVANAQPVRPDPIAAFDKGLAAAMNGGPAGVNGSAIRMQALQSVYADTRDVKRVASEPSGSTANFGSVVIAPGGVLNARTVIVQTDINNITVIAGPKP